jgi:hypothetical protein
VSLRVTKGLAQSEKRASLSRSEERALFSLLSLLAKREKANHLRKAREATPSMKQYLHFRSLAKREADEATPLITFTASVIPFTLGNFLHFFTFGVASLAKRASRFSRSSPKVSLLAPRERSELLAPRVRSEREARRSPKVKVQVTAAICHGRWVESEKKN